MKKSKKGNKIISRIIGVFIIGYVSYVFIGQQIDINKYAIETEHCKELIQQEQVRNEELSREKENINSEEYIEKLAREKLGFIMPNETVYIDSNRY